jgi:hypothetical protein
MLYPLVSVFPQEFLYRAFFFDRCRLLFGEGWGMVAASAMAFGFVHVIFRNWLAVGLCVIGEFLFSVRYQTSGSFLPAWTTPSSVTSCSQSVSVRFSIMAPEPDSGPLIPLHKLARTR